MPETRKLSTILFADIVGYTALMQSNEEKAMQFLHSFKTELNKIVPRFGGQIVQYFGDACLLSFDSASQGVHCAMSLQSSLRQAEIPIRIGMHLGEVLFTDDNAFGDGVNIASRIESMGIAGGIFISKTVRDQIKNKIDFELISLGSFKFKNVVEPLEVFAIANESYVVPKREELQGKFKSISSKHRLKWMIATGGLLLLAIAAFWILKPSQITLTAYQKNNQVAILPFENKTGLNDLDQFGTMISDWLTSGLMETGDAKIVRAIDIHEQVLKVSHPPKSIHEIYSSSGIGLIITGRYYLQEDKLFVQANILDTETGQVIYAPNPVIQSKFNLESILVDLSQLVMGFWEVRNIKSFQNNPPNYAAYQAYLKGLDDFSNRLESAEIHLKRAHELDTSFYSPLLQLSPFYQNHGRLHAKDSLLSMLATKQSNFTKWDLIYFKFVRARSAGNWYEAGQLAEQATLMDPSDFTFFARAAHAYQSANYPQKAIDVMLRVDMKLVSQENREAIPQWIDYSLFMQSKYEEVYSRYQKYFSEKPLNPWERPLYVQVLIKTGRFNEISEFLLNTKDTGPYNKGILLYRICNSLLIIKQDSLAKHFAQVLKDFSLKDSDNPDHFQLLGESEMFLQNWSQAINYFEQYIKDRGLLKDSEVKGSQLSIFGDLAVCYARTGNIFKANQLIKNVSWHSSQESYLNYNRARIEALNGNKNKSIEALAAAIQGGYSFNDYSYSSDHHLIPLFDHPSFKKLVAVKG